MAKGEQDRCEVDGCRRRWEFRAHEPGRAVVVRGGPVAGGGLVQGDAMRQVPDPSSPQGFRLELDEVRDPSWPEDRVEEGAEGRRRFCGPHFLRFGVLGAVDGGESRAWVEAGEGG